MASLSIVKSLIVLKHTTDFLIMTYKELLTQLQQLTEEQLNQDVAIWDNYGDEYYQASVEFVFATETDVLDLDHPIIRF